MVNLDPAAEEFAYHPTVGMNIVGVSLSSFTN